MQMLTIIGNFQHLLREILVLLFLWNLGVMKQRMRTLLNIENYHSLHQTRKYEKGGSICIYINKELEFKLKNYIDIFNDKIETSSVEIVNSKSRNFMASIDLQNQI